MTKTYRLLALLLCLALCCLTACGEILDDYEDDTYPDQPVIADGGAPAEAGDLAEWTVLLYLCGTDLESEGGAATGNLEEVLYAGLNEDVHFVMQTGGTAQWYTDGIDPSVLQRFELTEDGFLQVGEAPLASMGDAATLADFLSWGVQNYPADKTMVVFWNHGGTGLSGLEFDELFEGDHLTLTELSQGLAAADTTFEVIGFDTCLMGSLENATAIAPYGRYMVASEETEPGGGWDYEAWVGALMEDPSLTGDQIGPVICDSFLAKCERDGVGEMTTLATIDLGKIYPLYTAYAAMTDEMTTIPQDVTTLRSFVQGTTKSEKYGGATEEEGYGNTVDLADMVKNVQETVPGTADAVLSALDDAVLYRVNGSSRQNANGLSVYFPYQATTDELDNYAQTAALSGNYLRFIETLYDGFWQVPDNAQVQTLKETENQISAEKIDNIRDNTNAIEDAVKPEDISLQYDAAITDEGFYQLTVDDASAVQSVQFSLYFMDYDYNEYMLLGYDNDITADWETGVFQDNFRGVWPTLNGEYCAPQLVDEGEGYNLYSIPILLNGEETNLRCAYVWDDDENGHYEIYGAWDGSDESGMASRDITLLKDGDEVTLLFDAVNWETGEETSYEMGSFTVDGDVVMEESPLIDGDYLYQYVLTDVFGRVYYSPEIIMECKEGEITLYEVE